MHNKQIEFFFLGVIAIGVAVVMSLTSKTIKEDTASVSADDITTESMDTTESKDEMKEQEGAEHARIRFEKNLIYDVSNKDHCKVDVAFIREGTLKPLILCVHGGYYSSGCKEDMKEYLKNFSADGFVTASIDYPLLPDGTIVEQSKSVIKAVDYLAENADIYEIDTEKIILLGFSSGAHIAVLAAEQIVEQPENLFSLEAVIDISGPTDYRYMVEKYGGADSVSSAIIDGNEEADLLEELEKVDCTDNITGKLPRTLIIHGKNDKTVPYEVSERFYEALQSADVAAELEIIDSMGHATDKNTVFPLIRSFLVR